ncbi:hypothetical protein QYF61_020539 [Mycteria americana]|uniref:Ribosomal protein 63, mitochondrial n=2 Tax=Mycteria americana TaxID=33587 RepID=A0AAN7S4S4_MYCAM|nr:hypothetical protein QYF61_020539 [Mycteria americana]
MGSNSPDHLPDSGSCRLGVGRTRQQELGYGPRSGRGPDPGGLGRPRKETRRGLRLPVSSLRRARSSCLASFSSVRARARSLPKKSLDTSIARGEGERQRHPERARSPRLAPDHANGRQRLPGSWGCRSSNRRQRASHWRRQAPPALREISRDGPLATARRHLASRRGAGAVTGVGIMFLTTVLLRKRIPGKQWIGKYRRPRVVTLSMKQAMIRRLEIEAENEYWLSRPYLTREQEYKHNTEERRARWEAFKSLVKAKFPEHRYIGDHLNHLNVSRKWTS